VSAGEVDTAIFFSAAIIVAAFSPVFTMQGVEGRIFSPMREDLRLLRVNGGPDTGDKY